MTTIEGMFFSFHFFHYFSSSTFIYISASFRFLLHLRFCSIYVSAFSFICVFCFTLISHHLIRVTNLSVSTVVLATSFPKWYQCFELIGAKEGFCRLFFRLTVFIKASFFLSFAFFGVSGCFWCLHTGQVSTNGNLIIPIWTWGFSRCCHAAVHLVLLL